MKKTLKIGDFVEVIKNDGPEWLDFVVGEYGEIVWIGKVDGETNYVLDKWPINSELAVYFLRHELKKIDTDISELTALLKKENFHKVFTV